MTRTLSLMATVGLIAFLASPALAAGPAPTYGTFTDEQKAIALQEALSERLEFPDMWEAQDSHEEERLQEEAGRASQPPSLLRLNDDNDTAHYGRGRTLIINIWVNHNGGTWDNTERSTMAARNGVAKDFYVDEAPNGANVSWATSGNGYWGYTATLNTNIPDDGFTWDHTEDAVQALGFADSDGDGFYVDDMTIWLQNWNGGYDNVIAMFQPADITGRAFASFGFARIREYTDDSANVRAHEMGHSFGACDEYSSSACNCGDCQSEYLDEIIVNGNCQAQACPIDVSCVMIDNTFDDICDYTLNHWAWVDEDTDGQLDEVKRRVSGGTFANIWELWNGGWFSWNVTTQGMVYHQSTNSWGVVGLRSPATADYDLRVYGDNNHNYQYTSSSYGGTSIDFCVGDYNHSSIGNEHVEVTRFSGDTASYRLGYESGTTVLYPDGVARNTNWSAEDVVKIWDVPLFAGETVTFVLDVTSGTLDMGMSLFKSSGADYWAGRSSAQWTRDASGASGTESWTYTVPEDDVYGLVAFSNSFQAGTFTIKIGPTPAVLAEEVPFYSGLALRLFSYDPNSSYWSFIGNRPDPTFNTTVKLYNNSTYQSLLETSDNYNSTGPPNNTDFIAVDYNHVSQSVDYPRVIRESATGNHRTEWEHDAEILAGYAAETWVSTHVGKVWDAFLTGGQQYFLREYHSGGTGLDTGLYLFDSSDGDYYKARAEWDGAANGRPAVDGGEWFWYTPPTSNWCGVYTIVNDESAGSYSLWLGPTQPMLNDVAQTRSDEIVFGSGTVGAGYWHVFGVRPSPGGDVDVWLYGDNAYTISTLAVSDQSGVGVVNYVVADYNHTPVGTVYPRFRRASGSDMDMEFDGGTEEFIWLGGPPVGQLYNWPGSDVAEAYDIYLPAGVTAAISLDDQSGVLDLGMALFKSSGAEYYAHPGNAVASADAAGTGGDELMTYTTTSSDWYGLVVYNQNDNTGLFDLQIGSGGAVSAGIGPLPTAFNFASSPNPFRGQADLQFALPRDDHVNLAVYDVTGRLVRALLDESRPAGYHQLRWDGRDDSGQGVAAGVYLARLRTSTDEKIQKLIRVQ